MDERRRRDRQPSFFLISMLIQIVGQLEKVPNKPPITIFLLFVNIYVHIAPYVSFMGYDLTDISGNCLNPQKIVSSFFNRKNVMIHRMLFSSLIHADDIHLYYNMLSLCWKGINLETRLGSAKFLQLVIVSVLLCPLIMISITYGLNQIGFESQFSGYHSCAVGFSGVLFSLKYVWNQIAHEGSNILGINIPAKYAAWAELVFASLISPNVSFVGHLSGILAGMVYLHGSDWLSNSSVGQSLVAVLSSVFGSSGTSGGMHSSRNTFGSGTLGSGNNCGPRHTTSSSSSSYRANQSSATQRRPQSGEEFELETTDTVNAGEQHLNLNSEEVRKQRLKRFYL